MVRRLGGGVGAVGRGGEGATFYFTLGGGHRRGSSLPSKKAGIL
jgi:hypothetical protein